MKTLPTEFVAKNVTYKQVKRTGDVALYSYSPVNEPKRVRGYEVIIVQRHEAYEMHGSQIAAGETYPSTKSWGKKGWSYIKLDSALDKMVQVVENEQHKAEKRAEQPDNL